MAVSPCRFAETARLVCGVSERKCRQSVIKMAISFAVWDFIANFEAIKQTSVQRW